MERRKGRRLLVLLTAALLAFAGTATESRGSAVPEQGAPEREGLTDLRFRPRPGTYHYAFRFNGLSVGTAWVSLERDGGNYVIRFNARTNSTIDRVYRARFSGENVTEAEQWSPLGTRIASRVKSTSKDTAISFRDDGLIKSVRTEWKKGAVTDCDVREVQSRDFTMDPLSVVHLVRGVDWEAGMERSVQVFTGKRRYESRFTCTGGKVVKIDGEEHPAWEIVHESIRLDDKDGDTDQEKGERNLKIYLSRDANRDVLLIDNRRALGHFLVVLDGFEPAVQSAGSPRRSAGESGS